MEEVERLKTQVQKLQLADLYEEETKPPKNDYNVQLVELENVKAELEEVINLMGISDEQLNDCIKLLNKPKSINDKINNCKKIINYINENYEEDGYN
jgi:hypothetical protein